MTAIERDIDAAAQRDYDAIIVGGGIYGVMLLAEATRRGMQALLIEKDEFGSATSMNNLRIVHGGLRYLQTLHLTRHRESVEERRWFLREFPDLVRPLACTMPLYGGLKRNRALLRTALFANDWLSRKRNVGVPEQNHLPAGTLIGADEVRSGFPGVRTKGLRGAAVWYDAVMLDCRGLIDEALGRACSAGGTALDFVEATELVQDGGVLRSVIATDHRTGGTVEFRGSAVFNAAGPGVDRVNRQFGLPGPALFVPSLAWNLLFDREPLTAGAVALQPPRRRAQVYFAHSMDDRLFVGTGHAPLPPDSATTEVAEADIVSMIDDLNAAVPGLGLQRAEVLEILSGQLPVRRRMTTDLSATASIVRHSDHGGPARAISVSGVKFTTARSTAARALDQLH